MLKCKKPTWNPIQWMVGYLTHLRFVKLRQCCRSVALPNYNTIFWGLVSSGMWRSVTGWLIPDVSGHRNGFIRKDKMPPNQETQISAAPLRKPKYSQDYILPVILSLTEDIHSMELPSTNGLRRRPESTTLAVTDGFNSFITYNMKHKDAHFYAEKL